MRRKDKEITDIQKIEEIINQAEVCRLGLSHHDVPYVVPLNFGYHNGCLYFHSAREGKKLELIKKNKNVCFEIDLDHELVQTEIPCQWSMKYRSVIGYGTANLIEDFAQKKEALEIIVNHYTDYEELNFDEKAINNVTVIKVVVEEMSGKKSGYPE